MTKKYQVVDLSQVGEVTRDVLDITVSELLDLYCADKPNRQEKLRGYRLRKWREQFASLPAWQVTSAHIAAVVDAMESQEYEGATINRDVADIRSCYSWAIKRRYCPADFINPTVEYVRRPESVRRVVVSELQLARLLAQAKLSHWSKLYPLVLTALHSGGRKAEMLKLTWADVDAQLRCGAVDETKAGVPRRLILTKQALEAISAIRPTPCPDNSLVFCGRNPFKEHDFRRVWERCREEAGMPTLRFHDLRHVCAARYAKVEKITASTHTIGPLAPGIVGT